MNHTLGVFVWEMRRAHTPEGGGHEHAVTWRGKKVRHRVGFPALIEHQPHVLGVIAAHELVPIWHIGLVTGQAGHLYERVGYLKGVHRKPRQAFLVQLGEVPFVARLEELHITGVLINLPRTQNMLGGFHPVGATVPADALVV